jgi:hypothetical protein
LLCSHVSIIGTNVLARKNEDTMANPTESASGTNIARATPTMKNDGAKTARIESMMRSRGTTTSRLASRTARATGFLSARWRWMFSTAMTDSSTRIPMARVSPPSVIRFTVSPDAQSATSAERSASGMVATTTKALLMLPSASRIMTPVRSAPRRPSNRRARNASDT